VGVPPATGGGEGRDGGTDEEEDGRYQAGVKMKKIFENLYISKICFFILRF
jgi:hypothetical protein